LKQESTKHGVVARGMFIHWSLFSQLGGVWKGKMSGGGYAEWIMYNEKISIADYAAVAKDFNPVKYDAGKWVMEWI